MTKFFYKLRLKAKFINVFLFIFYLSLFFRKSPSILLNMNPTIPYGGAFKVSKKRINEEINISSGFKKEFFAETEYLEIKSSIKERISILEKFIENNGLPIIFKPDIGNKSRGVIISNNIQEAQNIVKTIPVNYIIQKYYPYENEIGLFFIKYPNIDKGMIFDVAELKVCSGSKISTHDYYHPYKKRKDLENQIIEERINNIMKGIPVYVCRFDIKVKNIEIFKSKAEEFKIVEINLGVDTVPLGVNDFEYSLIDRLKLYFQLCFKEFEISIMNAKKVVSFREVYRIIREYNAYINTLEGMIKKVSWYDRLEDKN